jgi:hypothetical protein
MKLRGERGDVVGALAIVVLLTGVVLCMLNTAWFPWINCVGLLIALAAIIFLKKRPAQKMPGFQRTSRGGMA